MRMNIHTIREQMSMDNVLSVSFDGYTIYKSHCPELWTFPDTQICIKHHNNDQITLINVYSGSVSIKDDIINIYTPKIISEADAHALNAPISDNALYVQYMQNRYKIFRAHNYMKDFLQKDFSQKL
jgi:hypothetical protein